MISVDLADGTALSAGGTCDAGSLAYCKTKDITITIANTGKNALTIGDNGITLTPYSGTEAGMFAITSRPASTLSVGGSGTLVLHFDATSSGTKAVSLSIASNDVSTADWKLRLAVIVAAPFSTIQNISRLIGEDKISTGLSITFTNATGATGYGLYRATSLTDRQAALSLNATPLLTASVPSDGSTTITVTDSTAALGTVYYYAVRTYNASGHADGAAVAGSISGPTFTGTATVVANNATLGYTSSSCGQPWGMAVDATTLYLVETMWVPYQYGGWTYGPKQIRAITKATGATTAYELSGHTYTRLDAACVLGAYLYVIDCRDLDLFVLDGNRHRHRRGVLLRVGRREPRAGFDFHAPLADVGLGDSRQLPDVLARKV